MILIECSTTGKIMVVLHIILSQHVKLRIQEILICEIIKIAACCGYIIGGTYNDSRLFAVQISDSSRFRSISLYGATFIAFECRTTIKTCKHISILKDLICRIIHIHLTGVGLIRFSYGYIVAGIGCVRIFRRFRIRQCNRLSRWCSLCKGICLCSIAIRNIHIS